MTRSRRVQRAGLTTFAHFTYLFDEIIQSIGAYAPIDKAFLLAQTSKRNLSLLLYPTRQRFLAQFAADDIKVDRWNTYCITRTRVVFICENEAIKDTNFELIPGLYDVKQALDSGRCFNMFITSSGEVYAKGPTPLGTHYHYPHYIPASPQPQAVDKFAGRVITKAMDDGVSACFLAADGQMRVVGQDGWGELGRGKEGFSLKSPALLRGIPTICDFHYTGRQLLLFSAQGLYVTGRNDQGQLALGHNNNMSIATAVQLGEIKLSLVKAAADKRFYALTPTGRVCAWGDNSNDLLGFGDQQEHNTPALLPGLHNIVDMDVTDENAIFVDNLGQVFVLGLNQNGELAMGNRVACATPTLNPYLSEIKKVFCKSQKSFFVNDGKVLFAGKTLGVFIEKPELIFANPESIEQIDAHNEEFIYRASDGAIYVDLRSERDLQKGKVYFHPKLYFLPPVRRMLDVASIKELLFYAEGTGSFARHCLRQAQEKIEQAKTPEELIAVLEEVNMPAWRDSPIIKKMIPAYHLILRHCGELKGQQGYLDANVIKLVWAQLLVMYRGYVELARSTPHSLQIFRDMLVYVGSPPSATHFAPKVNKKVLELRRRLYCDREALRVVARFLAPELPPPPPSLKRTTEELPEDDDRRSTFKKAKR